jgi:MtN3 and saliva related transmembrane protein
MKLNLVEILGYLAAFCTTISFLPQAIRVIKTKHTKDLSLLMYSILNVGIVLWLIYGIAIGAWPIIIANLITIVLTLTILYLKIRYK